MKHKCRIFKFSALEKQKEKKIKEKKKIEEWNNNDCGTMLSGLRKWEKKKREMTKTEKRR